MDELLRAYHNFNKCIHRISPGKYQEMSDVEKRSLCINEKIALINILFSEKLNTSNLIKDELEIINVRNEIADNERKAVLDGQYNV